MGHLKGGRPNVHSVKKGDDVEYKQKGQETLRNTMPGALTYLR
jgi:hypothetical protein